MERSLSVDEKIRRAEEIYSRRNNMNETRTATVNVGGTKGNIKLKKMLIQVLICILIYVIYYLITTTNYSFSSGVIGKTKEVLSHDINFIEIYNNVVNSFKKEESNVNEMKQENNNQEADMQEESSNINEENAVEEENTLSASEENIYQEESSSFNQMDTDANEIKSNYSLIKPLEGAITSRYGVRNPTTETVPKYHTGVDIASDEGKVIIAAMDGTVNVVSSEGDYRKSYKNIK